MALGDNVKAVEEWEAQSPAGLNVISSDIEPGAPKGHSMKGATFTHISMFAAVKRGTYHVEVTAFAHGEPAAELENFVVTVVVF